MKKTKTFSVEYLSKLHAFAIIILYAIHNSIIDIAGVFRHGNSDLYFASWKSKNFSFEFILAFSTATLPYHHDSTTH